MNENIGYYNIFTAVLSQARAFVDVSHFYPSLIFAGMGGAHLSGANVENVGRHSLWNSEKNISYSDPFTLNIRLGWK
jgi:hypothetical protein